MRLRHAILLLPLLAGVGCARFGRVAREGRPIVLPASGADPAPFEAALARRLAGLKTFRARGILQVAKVGEPIRQADFLLITGPNAEVRLRGTRAIGPTLFELVADTERFAFSIPPRRTWFEGVRGRDEADTGLLVPSSVIDPLRVTLRPDSVRLVAHEPEGTALVEVAEAGGPGRWRMLQRIEFASETGRPRRAVVYDAQGAAIQINTFTDYRALPGFGPDDAFPFSVQVERPAAALVVTLQFRQVVPNVTPPAGAFAVTPPAGYEVRPVAEFDPGGLATASDDAGDA